MVYGQFVSSSKVNILLRTTSEATTGYYFRTKGKQQRETFFLEHNFFSPSQNTMSNVWGKGNMYGARGMWEDLILKSGF